MSAKVLKPTIIPPIIKLTIDSPAIVLVMACADSARVHASPSSEHQVLDGIGAIYVNACVLVYLIS